MIRKQLREQGWAQIEVECRVTTQPEGPELQTAANEDTHQRIVDLACKNIILGSYKDVEE